MCKYFLKAAFNFALSFLRIVTLGSKLLKIPVRDMLNFLHFLPVYDTEHFTRQAAVMNSVFFFMLYS